MRVAGSTTLVTGSSRGIGAALARELARRGAQVVLHGRDADALDALARELDTRALCIDLLDPDGPERLAALVPGADLVVHCAGAGWAGGLAAMPPADIERLIRLNLTAPMRLTGAVLPTMMARGGGHIAFVASIAGLLGVAEESVYSATKAGLLEFAEQVRTEAGPSGVGVSAICPAAVDTAFWDGRGAAYERRFPRMLTPEQVAAVAVDDIENNHPRRVQPEWLSAVVALQRTVPQLYHGLAARFG